MFALCRPKHQGLLQGEHPEILNIVLKYQLIPTGTAGE